MGFFSKLRGALPESSPPLSLAERIEPTIDKAETIAARSTGPMAPRKGMLTDSPAVTSNIARTVTFDRALTLSAVFACIKILVETVSRLPIEMYRFDKNGDRLPEVNHPLIKLLRNKPNPYQGRVSFMETLMLNLVAGNSFIKKGFFNKELVRLDVVNNGSMRPELLSNGALQYTFYDSQGKKNVLQDKDIMHIRLFGPGLMGMSPISYGAHAMGIGLAADSKVGRVMENGAKPTGALVRKDGKMFSDEQRNALRKEMTSLIAGDDWFLPVLEGGLEFEKISLSPADIELLETRRFSVEEVCRFFGVPSILINDTSGATTWGSGIEQIIEGFSKFGLGHFLEKIEEAFRLELLPREDWDKYEFEFKISDLLRASLIKRIEANQKRILSGQATINQVRKEEGYQPVEGGDNLLVPVNMTTLDRLISGQSVPVNTGVQQSNEQADNASAADA